MAKRYKDLGINKVAKKLVKKMQRDNQKELKRLIKAGNYYTTKESYD
jgi:hypothetical protein